MARQQFLYEMENRLKAFDEQMSKLANKPKAASERAQQEREKTYFFLKAKRAELREQLAKANSLPEDAWDKFQQSVERVFNDMSSSMDEAARA
jgi:ribosome recycling factor